MYSVGLDTEALVGGQYTSMELGDIFSNKNGDVALVAFPISNISQGLFQNTCIFMIQEIMTAEVQSNTCLYLYSDVRLRALKKTNYPMTPNPYSNWRVCYWKRLLSYQKRILHMFPILTPAHGYLGT